MIAPHFQVSGYTPEVRLRLWRSRLITLLLWHEKSV